MSADSKPVYWVSFLDGLQRVLLFTEDFKLAYRASQVRVLLRIFVNFMLCFNLGHFFQTHYLISIKQKFLGSFGLFSNFFW